MLAIQSEEEFTKNVLESEKPVIVDFFTEWCAPCRKLVPILEEMANEMDNVSFCKVDAGTHTDIAQKYDVFAFPTVVLFKGGNAVAQEVGLRPKDKLIEWVNSHAN